MGPKKPQSPKKTDEEITEYDKKLTEMKDQKKPTTTPPISASSSKIPISGRRSSTPTVPSPLNPSAFRPSSLVKKDASKIPTAPLSKIPRPQTPTIASGPKVPGYLQGTTSSKAKASPPPTQSSDPLTKLGATPKTTVGVKTGGGSGSAGGSKQSIGSLRPTTPAEEISPAPFNLSGDFSEKPENNDSFLSFLDTSPAPPPLNLPQTPSTYTLSPAPPTTAHRPSVTLPPNPNVSPQSDPHLFTSSKPERKKKAIPASIDLTGSGDLPEVNVEPATPDAAQDAKQGKKKEPVFDPNRLSPAEREDAKGKSYLKEFKEFVITPLSLTPKEKKAVPSEENSSGRDDSVLEESSGGEKDENEKKDNKGGKDEQVGEEGSKDQDPSNDEEEDDDDEEPTKPGKKKQPPYFEPITKFPPRIADSSAGVYVPVPDELPLPQSPVSPSQSPETTDSLYIDLEEIINQSQDKQDDEPAQSLESHVQSPRPKVLLPLHEDKGTTHSSAGSSSSDDKDEDGNKGRGKNITAEEKKIEKDAGGLTKFPSPPGGKFDEGDHEKEESKATDKAKQPPKPSPQGLGNRGDFGVDSRASHAPRNRDRGLITGGGGGRGLFPPFNPTFNPTIPPTLHHVADDTERIEEEDYQAADLEGSSQPSPKPPPRPRPQPARIFARPVVPPFPIPRPANTPLAPVDDVRAPRTTGPGDNDSLGEQFLDQVRRGNEEMAALERRKREAEKRDRERLNERENEKEKEREKERERRVQNAQARRPENARRELPRVIQDFRDFIRNNPKLSWTADAQIAFDSFEAVNLETQAKGLLRAQQLADGARAFNALQDVNNDLSNQLGQLQEINENLKARMTQLQEADRDEINQLEHEIQDAGRENEDAEERRNRIVDRELRVLREEYETEIEKLKGEHAAELQAQHKTIHELQEKVKAAAQVHIKDDAHKKATQKLEDKHYVETREDQEMIGKLNEDARAAAKAHKEEIHQQNEKFSTSRVAYIHKIQRLEKEVADATFKTQGNEDGLKKEIKDREAEIKKLQNKLGTANGTIRKLEKDLAEATFGKQDNNNELNRKLKDNQVEIKKLQSKLKTANEELVRDKKLFDDQKREINDMKADLRNEKTKHKEEINNLSDNNTISMVEHKRHLKEQRDADEAQLIAERCSLQDTINKLEEELDELDAKPKAKEMPQGMITEVECKKRNIDETNKLNAEIKNLENVNAGLVEHHATQVNRANKLQEQLDRVATPSNKEVAELRQNFKTAQEHVLTLQVRLVNLRTTLEESPDHAMLFNLQERLEEVENDHLKAVTKVRNLEAKLEDATDQKAAYKKKLKAAEKDFQKLQDKIAELQTAIKGPANNATIPDLRQQLAAARKNLQTAQAEITQLRAAASQIASSGSAAALLQELQTAETRLAAVEERLRTAEEELTRLRAEADNRDEEEEDNWEEEYVEERYGEHDWDELHAYIVELKARLTEAQALNTDPLKNLQKADLSGVNPIPGDEENLSDLRMLDRLRDMLGYYQAIKEQNISELGLPKRLNKLRTLEKDNRALTTRMGELEAEIRRLTDRLQAQTPAGELTAQVTSLKVENGRLIARVTAAEADNYRLKTQVDELYEDNQRVTDLTGERDLAREGLAALGRDFDELQERFDLLQEDLKARETDLASCSQEQDDLRDEIAKNLGEIKKFKKRAKDLEARLNVAAQGPPEPRPEGEYHQANPSIAGFDFAITRTRNFFRIMRGERAAFDANPPEDVAGAVEAVQEALDIANALPEEINAPRVAQAELEAGIVYYYAANIDEAELHFAAADVLREDLPEDEAALLDRWIAWIAAGHRVEARRQGYMTAEQRATERLKRDSALQNATLPQKKSSKGKSSKAKSKKPASKQSKPSKKKENRKDTFENSKKPSKKNDPKDKKSGSKSKSKKAKNLVGVVRYPIRLASWQQLRNLRRTSILIDPVDDNEINTESRYLTTAQMAARNMNHPNQEEMVRLERSIWNDAGREQGPLSRLLGSLWRSEVPRDKEEVAQEEKAQEEEPKEEPSKDREDHDVLKPQEQGTLGRFLRSLRL